MGHGRKHKDYLSLLAKSKSRKRRNALIELADRGEILAIAECIHNILRGNVRLPTACARRMRRHKNDMRMLAKKTGSIKSKKKLLKQRGGFLPAILPIAVSLLGSVLPAILKKKK